jgi:hypothetical protein
MILPVFVIGWKPRPGDPPALQPQFDNPVPARIYVSGGVRLSSAWLRISGAQIVAALDLDTTAAHPRCFCCTHREYDPVSRLERRRITSVDIVA